jgi:vitamin B12 transporter
LQGRRRIPANGYTLVNLAASYDLGHGVTVFGRIDNLLNRQYQNPLGFEHPGLCIYVGLRLALGPGAATGQRGGTSRE